MRLSAGQDRRSGGRLHPTAQQRLHLLSGAPPATDHATLDPGGRRHRQAARFLGLEGHLLSALLRRPRRRRTSVQPPQRPFLVSARHRCLPTYFHR